MKHLLIVLPLLVGCAYGTASQEQKYGKTQGNQSADPNDDGGDSNWGDDYNNGDIPYGCYLETINETGSPIFSVMICPSNPQLRFKNLIDPSPFKGNK